MKKLTDESLIENFYKSKAVTRIIGNWVKQDDQINSLKEIFSFLLSMNKKPSNGWYKRLAYFHQYNLDPGTWLDRVKTIVNKTPMAVTLENMILLYGRNEGKVRWELYRTAQGVKNTFEAKQQKYGWTREEFDQYNKSRSSTLLNFIRRYGEFDGTLAWQAYCERQAYTNTLEYFKEKYGHDEGFLKWKECNWKKSRVHNPEWISEQLQISIDDAVQFLSANTPSCFVSEIEKHFVDTLEETLAATIKYSYKTQQFGIWDPISKRRYVYDVCCPDRMKIIEFYGDYWHANPYKYSPNFLVKQSGKTAKEIWDFDQQKILAATNRGFEVKIIWEHEYIEFGIDSAINFWTNKRII